MSVQLEFPEEKRDWSRKNIWRYTGPKFPNLIKKIYIYIYQPILQEVQQIAIRLNQTNKNNHTSRHVTVKLLKIKEKNPKSSQRENSLHRQEQWQEWLLSWYEIMQTKIKLNFFKILGERIDLICLEFCVCKNSLQNEGRMKTYSDKQNLKACITNRPEALRIVNKTCLC